MKKEAKVRKITWKEYFRLCWPTYLAAGLLLPFFVVFVTWGLAKYHLQWGMTGNLIIIIIGSLGFVCISIIPILEKRFTKIHFCGKIFSTVRCPTCGVVCQHCGKKVEKEER